MIVEMKKVVLLTLEKDKLQTLEELRKLGVMHLDPFRQRESQDGAFLEKQIRETARIAFLMESVKGSHAPQDPRNAEEILKEAQALVAEKDALLKEKAALEHDREILAPWGDFQKDLLEKLAANGVYVTLCSAQENEIASLGLPEGALVEEISRTGKKVYFVVISREKTGEENLPCVGPLPEHSLAELEEKYGALLEKEKKNAARFSVLAGEMEKLNAYQEKLSFDLEFIHARDTMREYGAIACISGYVPVHCLDAVNEAAKKSGWALMIEDVAEEDLCVPTCIQKPKWMNIIDPLFEFIGISPGYRETDVTLFVLLAFPVFFGLIIGDSAYGLLFMITAILCKYLFRKKKKVQLPLNLLILLSCFSLLWGLLTGTCLGLPRENLPFFLQGLDFLAEPSKSPLACSIADRYGLKHDDLDLSNRFTQFLCFFLAALHLIAARLRRLAIEWPDWHCFNNAGWALILLGNFFTAVSLIVFPGFFPGAVGYGIYGAGFILVVTTVRKSAVLNLPFDFTGSFVDVLSYIRLFAVGLSGFYLAQCFNMMALQILHALPSTLMVIGIIGLVLVAVFGHVLNILLGFLSVLVHAIRLNTLEFSNHIGLQWTGISYHPFAGKKEK